MYVSIMYVCMYLTKVPFDEKVYFFNYSWVPFKIFNFATLFSIPNIYIHTYINFNIYFAASLMLYLTWYLTDVRISRVNLNILTLMVGTRNSSVDQKKLKE